MGLYIGKPVEAQEKDYSALEIALGEKIYAQRYAAQGGKWSAVETRDVWFEMARELISFIASFECDHEFEWDTAAETFLCLHCDEEAPADLHQETGLDVGSGEPC